MLTTLQYTKSINNLVDSSFNGCCVRMSYYVKCLIQLLSEFSLKLTKGLFVPYRIKNQKGMF